MKTTFAASVLCAAALLIGCASTQQADVSPGAVDATNQDTLACSPTSCKVSSSCPSAAKKADETASPGALGGTAAAKSCCPKPKGDAPKQCPSMKAKETAADETVSPGAVGDRTCCPPCPPCPKCPAHPKGDCGPCAPCPAGGK
ncbi:MAG: hypothetical protein ACYSU7_04535 [Planctomycetota bacterium]|jgi:hypothetical protein